MRHLLQRASAITLGCALLLSAGCAHARPGTSLAVSPISTLPASHDSHVVLVVMENEETTSIIGNPAAPYANGLARRYGLALQSYAITHPSLPNYLALTSGATHGIASDCTSCRVAAPNIVDQLEAAGISWKAYLEDQPTACFDGAAAGGYAKKHNPFIYYEDIVRSPRRCHELVGFATLAADLRRGRLPTYAWITPNLCDDGHDCPIASSDKFLARTIPALLRELGPHGFLVLTWDEGSSDRGCCAVAHGGRIATIVIGPDVRRGAKQTTPVDHYGVLATVEEALALAPLASAGESGNGRLDPLFTHPPRLR